MDQYLSACYSCRMSFDALEAAWCSCVTKQRSLICPYCLNCFCSAPHPFVRSFWANAPQELWTRWEMERTTGLSRQESPEVRPLVLVVDDDPDVRAIATGTVSALGYGVVVADRALLAGKEAGRKQVIVAASVTQPTLDEASLASLRELGARSGTPLIAELTDLFFRMLPERIATLEESAARGDAARLERTAHTLRSAAGNLGARKLATLCAELETLALTAPTEANATLVNGIVIEAGRVVAALREL